MSNPSRPGLTQVADELRLAWRDLTGGLRSTSRGIADEGRAILRELDAPRVEKPGVLRRSWRFVRRAPIGLQLILALAFFALWIALVVHVFTAGSPPPPQPQHTDTGLVGTRYKLSNGSSAA